MQSLPDLIHTLRDPSALISAVGFIGITAIIFIETGLLFPMLPGDSLLVTAGLLASQRDGPVHLNVWVLGVCCSVAAILGNSSGYLIGHRAGKAFFAREDSRWFKHSQIVRAHEFYERHGGKTVVIARFMPIFRTFVPVVAGAAHMDFRRYTIFNVVGATLWVWGMLLTGDLLGRYIPGIDQHIDLVIIIVILLSLTPGAIAWLRRRRVPAPSPSTED